MATQTVEALVEGGKATAAPPLGPALGPLGVNIGQVVAEINEKTKSFNGMQVPVSVNVDTDTKEFTIGVGTPPAASLIIKEAKIKGGSGRPLEEHVADLKIEQIIKIAKMKESDLLGKNMKSMVKEIIGTCNSMGVKVEGKHAADAIKEVNAGTFDKEIAAEKTELSEEELKALEEERKALQAEIEKRHAEERKRAQEIMDSMEEQERAEIVSKMREEEISEEIINELLPVEPGAAAGIAKPAGPGEGGEGQ